MKIWRFEMKDIKRKRVLSKFTPEEIEKKICARSKDFGKKSEVRLVGS